MPPYDETTSKHVCPKYIKKLKEKPRSANSGLINTNSGMKSKTRGTIRSGKKSAKKRLGPPTSHFLTFSRQEDFSSMTRKLENLMQKPQHQWTSEDRKLIKMIREYNN